MKHHFIDLYAALDSPLHTLEARSKILAFTALIVCVPSVPAGSGVLLFARFFVAAIPMGISRVPLIYIMGRILLILPFIVPANLAVPWRGIQGLGTLFARAILGLKATPIIATHDLEFVLDAYSRTVLMDQGKMKADGKTRSVLSDARSMELHGLEAPSSLGLERNTP